jgi:hypothetical protein
MSTSTPSSASSRALNAEAARVLGLERVEVETVTVRPASREDLLAAIESGEDLRGYTRDDAGFLLPAVVHHVRTRDVFAAIPNPKPRDPEYIADRNTVVGQAVRLEGRNVFGTSAAWEGFTTEEAEEAALLLDSIRRTEFYVDDPNGQELPLMPVHGAQATVSVIVEGIDADDLAERIEALLAAEFGPALGKNRKVLTRPVENRRVDVADATNGTLHAVGILAAEVPLVMNGRGAVETRPHKRTDGLIIGS